MKVSKRFLWMKPLVIEAVKRFKLKRPASIRVYTPRRDKEQDTLATITYTNRGNYRITIQDKVRDGKELFVLRKSRLLDSLAHELAHIRFWNHKKEWRKLKKELTIFIKNLKRKRARKIKSSKSKNRSLLKKSNIRHS